MKRFLGILLLAWIVFGFPGCDKPKASEKKEAPAKIENPVKESDLTTIKLTPEAEKRLGIQLTTASYRSLAGTRKLGGEIIAIPGRSALVSAPTAGVVMTAQGIQLQSGAHVTKGQTIFRLLPLPSGTEMGTAEDVALKKTELELAEKKAARAHQLLLDKAGSAKADEEAQTQLRVAQAAYKNAQARFHATSGAAADPGTLAQVTTKLVSPLNGVIQKIHVASGQTVSAAASIFEVISTDPVWVRIPVYVGDEDSIQKEKAAEIYSLGAKNTGRPRMGRPVSGPPVSDPTIASIDIYYEVPNQDSMFIPGEKVDVILSEKEGSASSELVVPFSSIINDAYGGTWVYEMVAPHVFTRRRVEVRHVVDSLAIISRGLKDGVKVVEVGAAELFGSEFGSGK